MNKCVNVCVCVRTMSFSISSGTTVDLTTMTSFKAVVLKLEEGADGAGGLHRNSTTLFFFFLIIIIILPVCKSGL